MPGLQWIGVRLLGRSKQQGPPLLASMRWWSTRGGQASFKRDEEGKLRLPLAAQWGRRVVHVFDQGEASSWWLGLLRAFQLRFVLRWRKDSQLVDAQGHKRKAWQLARGKRGSRERPVWDSRQARWLRGSVLVLPVRHPDHPETPLWLVVARRAGQLPWYLLTAEPIETEEQAWQVVWTYARRWQMEVMWRYDKSELAEHPPTVVAVADSREAAVDGPASFLRFPLDALGALL